MKKNALLALFLFASYTLWAQSTEKVAISQMLDNWHRAAATADEDVFFGSMTKECIYIGTDKTERWLRDELREWSAKYFERDKAWVFKPIEREVYFDSKGKVAWFNETLDTWMGVCRSSGVVVKTKKEGWKLSHYHLSVTIDNALINGFKSLIISQPVSDEAREAVLAPIHQLFEAMKEGNGEKLGQVFLDSATLHTTGINKEGKIMFRKESIAGFIESVSTPHEEVYDERISDYDIRIDGSMATVWTPYEFYVGEKFSHCGINAFQLIQTEAGWKILHITDTRRRTGCQGKP